MSFFKRLADVLNSQHWGVSRDRVDVLAPFAKKHNVSFDEALLASVHSVEFRNSLCVLKKAPADKNELGPRTVVGRMALVDDEPVPLDGGSMKPHDQAKNPWSSASMPLEIEIEANRELVKMQREAINVHNRDYHELRERIRGWEEAMATQHEKIASLHKEVQNRDQNIAALKSQINTIASGLAWHHGSGLEQAAALPIGTTFGIGRRVALRPRNQVEVLFVGRLSTKWKLTGHDPQFELVWADGAKSLPPGHYRLEITGTSHEKLTDARLFLDNGKGYNEAESIGLSFQRKGGRSVTADFSLYRRTRSLRFDPSNCPGILSIGRVRLRKLSRIEQYSKLMIRFARHAIGQRSFRQTALAVMRVLRRGGVRELAATLRAMGMPRSSAGYEDPAFVRRIESCFSGNPGRFNGVKVSVIMPAYNRQATIEKAIRSVLTQTHSNWELIVVDDGSDDGTRDIVRRFTDDTRVTLVEQEHGGVSRARNAGLGKASGQIVAYLDSDNAWRPDFLRNMVVIMTEEGYECAFASLAIVDDLGVVVGYRGQEFDWNECLRGNFVDLNVYCHVRDEPRLDSRFDENLRRTVDWDFILRQTRSRRVGYPVLGFCFEGTGKDAPSGNRHL